MEKTLDEAINYTKEAVKTYRAEATYNFPELKEYYDNCVQCANHHDQLAEWLEELKSYKEAEEQGLLARLPVPLGSKVYWISTRDKQNPIIFEKIFVLGMLYFGDSTVFATREEAEKKLEKMKNE